MSPAGGDIELAGIRARQPPRQAGSSVVSAVLVGGSVSGSLHSALAFSALVSSIRCRFQGGLSRQPRITDGASFTSVTVMVTADIAVAPTGSVAVTVTTKWMVTNARVVFVVQCRLGGQLTGRPVDVERLRIHTSIQRVSQYVTRISGYNASAQVPARRRVLLHFPGLRCLNAPNYSGPGLGTPDRCSCSGARRTLLAESSWAVLSSPSSSSYMALARSLLPISPVVGVYMLVTELAPSIAPVMGGAAPVPLPGDGGRSLVVRVSQGGRNYNDPPGAAM